MARNPASRQSSSDSRSPSLAGWRRWDGSGVRDPARRISAHPCCRGIQPIHRHPWRSPRFPCGSVSIRAEHSSSPTARSSYGTRRNAFIRVSGGRQQLFRLFSSPSLVHGDGERGRGRRPACNNRHHLLAWLVSHAAALRHVLATTEDVPDQPVSTEKALVCLHGQVICGLGRWPLRPPQTGLDQGPAPAYPVAVAAVDELVGATGKATLGCVLAGREPRDKSRDIKIPTGPGSVSMQGFQVDRL